MNSRGKGIVLSYGYLIINMLCGVFLSSYLISELGDTEYGIYQTISSFANYLVMLEFGTGTIMTRNISMCRGSGESKLKINENISTIWTVTNILAAVIALVSVVMYFSIEFIYADSFTSANIQNAKYIFIFIAINLLISFYAQSFTGLTLAFEKYSYGPVLKTAKIVARTLLLGVLIIKFKYSIVIAIVDTLISIVSLIVSWRYCKKNFDISIRVKYFNPTIFKKILPFAIALFLQTIITQANNSVDKFLIGIFISPEAVAQYSIALFVFSIFSSICTVPTNMYAPQIAKELKAGIPMSVLSAKMASGSKLTALIGGSVLFGFAACGRPFITLLYGENYIEYGVWTIAIILMMPSLLVNLLGVAINVLDVLEKRMVYSVALCITTVMNVILTVIGIQIVGSLGAACATCFSLLVFQFPIMCFYYKKVIKIDIGYMLKESLLRIFPCQIIGAITGYTVSEVIPYDRSFSALIALILSGVTYMVVFFALLLFVDKTFRTRLKNIISKYKK